MMTLPVKIEAHEAQNKIWREITHLESISDTGAGFYLSREFEAGQLLHLTMPLEKDLRLYDLDAEQYSIWGIIRHCHRTLRNKFSVYHTGVAFIGQHPPAGYHKNPSTIYKPGKIKEDGCWEIEKDSQTLSRRKTQRYAIPIDIYIAVCDAEENIIAHERTVTENISETGASVFSGLQLNIGDTVRVYKQNGSFSVDAIVRNCRIGADNLPRLHLEFVNVRFPLEGID